MTGGRGRRVPLDSQIWLIAGTAASLGFIHTVLGPDHYLPFIVIARARGWRLGRTLGVSFLCGLGHVLSSVLLGLAGIALGTALFRLERIESFRGGLAAWFLIAFGLAYGIWGLRRAIGGKPHRHPHVHGRGESHEHDHTHDTAHAHPHEDPAKTKLTPWILFIIFIFGPCEPLIPMIMFPAARHNTAGVLLVAAAFSAATLLTMLAIIALASWGAGFLRLGRLERYAHALAGAVIFLSGVGIQFLGL